MEVKYDATYHSKTGETIIHVVAPLAMTEEELKERIRRFHYAGWQAWKVLSARERLRLNEETKF